MLKDVSCCRKSYMKISCSTFGISICKGGGKKATPLYFFHFTEGTLFEGRGREIFVRKNIVTVVFGGWKSYKGLKHHTKSTLIEGIDYEKHN